MRPSDNRLSTVLRDSVHLKAVRGHFEQSESPSTISSHAMDTTSEPIIQDDYPWDGKPLVSAML